MQYACCTCFERPILLELGCPLKICGDVHGQSRWHVLCVPGTVTQHAEAQQGQWPRDSRPCSSQRKLALDRYSDLLKLFECGGFPPEAKGLYAS